MGRGLRIVELKAENVKRLRAVDITPDPGQAIVQVTGRNSQGKTSVLDSIEIALKGGAALPRRPIHSGADRAEIVLDLGHLRVKRVITAKGSYLEVTNAEGAVYKSPQALLDGLLGDLSFDPLEFARMRPAQQRDMLIELTGQEDLLRKLNAERAQAFEERRDVNREAKRLEGARAQCEEQPAERPATLDVDALQKQQEQIAEQARARAAAEQKAEAASAAAEAAKNVLAELEKHEATAAPFRAQEAQGQKARLEQEAREAKEQIDRELARALDQMDKNLKATNDAAENKLEEATVQAGEAERKLAEARQALADTPEADPTATTTLLDEARAADAAAAKWDEAARLRGEHEQATAEADRLTARIAELDAQKDRALTEAPIGVRGVGIDDLGVTFNGQPFEQAGSAEQLRLSLAIAMAANPTVRVIRIMDGSLLDPDNLLVVEEMAAEHGYQVWIERVDASGQVGIVIEDGAVANAPAVEPDPHADVPLNLRDDELPEDDEASRRAAAATVAGQEDDSEV
jgi:hypothetical protein